MMSWRSLARSPVGSRVAFFASQLAFAVVGYSTAFVLAGGQPFGERVVATLPWLVAIRLFLAHRFRLDRGYWHHAGFQDVLRLGAAATVGSALFPVVLYFVDELHGVAPVVLVLDWLLAIMLTSGTLVAARFAHERRRRAAGLPGKRVFIIGAGEAGEQLLRQLLHDGRSPFQVVGLIDDDPDRRDRCLHGVPVLGTADELRGLAALHRVAQAIIAIPSATGDQLRRLVERCRDAGVGVKLVPPLRDLAADVHLTQCRDVEIEDLLGREPITLDLSTVAPVIAGRVVLVTGAGGSIGSELARQVAAFRPRAIVLVDRAESPLYFIQLDVERLCPEAEVIPVLASITNTARMQRIFAAYTPDCVFHAAAYKHVPLLEHNIAEAVWNNVIGTWRLAQCAAQHRAARFVLISTDKAVNPTSMLGATKRIAERIVLELPSLQRSGTDFRVVRFGNVLGSDGSVVPLFKRQLAAGGPLTVTHPDVRRYFMTIPEAVQLVLQASALPEAAGRISVLEMGRQIRVVELAQQLIQLAGFVPYKDVNVVFTGLRPGEKLEEELVGDVEEARATSVDKIRVVDRNGRHPGVLTRRLRQLVHVVSQGDDADLLRAIAALVPEYRAPAPELRLNGRHRRPRSPRRQPTHAFPRLGRVPAPDPLDAPTNGTPEEVAQCR